MRNTFKLDVASLLPDVADVHDACLVRLISTLEAHDGIESVHVEQGPAHHPEQLCVHHDEERLPAGRVLELVTVLSETLRLRFGHMSAQFPSPVQACESFERLHGLSGVRSVECKGDFLHIEYNRDSTSEAAIRTVLDNMWSKIDAA